MTEDEKAYQDYLDYQKYISESPKNAPVKEGSTGEALLGGAQQGMLAGYAPQVSGLIAQSLGSGTEDIDKELAAKGFKVDKPNLYLKARDEEIARQSALQEESPYAYRAGQLGGAVATIPAFGAAAKGALGAAKAVPGLGAGARLVEAGMGAKPGLLGRSAQAAVGGATQAAVMNPGDVEGQITGLQVPERIENAKQAGLLSAAIPAAGAVLGKTGKAIGALPKRLETMADTRAAAALGLNKSQAKKLIAQDPTGFEGMKLKELGNFVQKKGIVQVGDEITDIAGKAAQVKKATGEAIGSAYDAAESALSGPNPFKGLPAGARKEIMATNFNKKKMAEEFKDLIDKKMKGQPGGAQAVSHATSELDNFLSNEKSMLGIRDIQEFKSNLDDIIFKADKPLSGIPTEKSSALKLFRDFLKEKVDKRVNVIDKYFGSEIGVNLKQLNKQYGLATTANKIARDRLAGETGNNWLSLTDKIALGGGVAGAAAGLAQGQDLKTSLKGAALGLGAGLLSKGARTYGRPALMVGAKKAGEALGSLPPGLPSLMNKGAGLIEKAPGASGAAAVRGLMNQRNERK